ncbi:MAG: hypothetical protein ACRC0X_04335 [Brevinema sp.]
MSFGAGILYVILSVQVTLVLAGQVLSATFSGKEPTDPPQVALTFEEIQKTIHTQNEQETLQAIPQVFDIIMKEQTNYNNTYPMISRYQITESNVIVYFDEKYFEDLLSKQEKTKK